MEAGRLRVIAASLFWLAGGEAQSGGDIKGHFVPADRVGEGGTWLTEKTRVAKSAGGYLAWLNKSAISTPIEGRLRSQQKLLSKICGMMFPPLFGRRTNAELCYAQGWDKNLPSHLLGALPKRS